MAESNVRQRKVEKSAVETSTENVKPTSKTAGWTMLAQIFITLLTVPFVYVAYVFLLVDAPFEVKEVKLPVPREWTGPLAVNTELQRAIRLYHNEISGPESLIFDQGHLYATTYDGKVVHIEDGAINTIAAFGTPPCGRFEDEKKCGRPLGMRYDHDKYLVVMDAYKGMFRLNAATGDYYQYFSADIVIDGEKPKFLNDLDIDSDGIIYFTDSSTKWYRNELVNIFLEGENTGRLIKYDPVKNTTEVLVKGLYFANGVQLSRKEDYILVCETGIARVLKYNLKGPKAGKLEVFSDNLPGYPDNIRRAKSGGFWVGGAFVRNPGKFCLIDYVLQRPKLREFLSKAFRPETLLSFYGLDSGAIVMQLSETGDITRTLHDPTGSVIKSASEIEDNNGILYIGSYKAPFIGKLDITVKKT